MHRNSLAVNPLGYAVARHILIIIFLLSRLAYYAVGLRFNTAPIRQFWQMADPLLLRTDLAQTLWYMHMQPPGYNLLIGLALKLFPEAYGTALFALHVVSGLSIALLLLHLMESMGVSPRLSLWLTAFFIASPVTLLYENAATYDYLVCVLLLVGAIALLRFTDRPNALRSIAFFGSFMLLALIRNLFHVVYLVIIFVGALIFFPKARRAVVAGALPALVIVSAMYVKNGILFGRYTASTWDGMQLGRITTDQLTAAERTTLVANGTLSQLALIPTFSALSTYRPYLSRTFPETGLPILDEEVTSTGHNNYNALPYLEVHDHYTANARQVLLHYPTAFYRALASGWFCYFRPSSDLPLYFADEASPISRWERIFSGIFYGQLHRTEDHAAVKSQFYSGHVLTALTYTGLWLVILLPAVTAWGLLQLIPPHRARNWTRGQQILIAYLLLNIIVLTFTVNTLSFQENNRYRFPLEPFYFTLLGMMIQRLILRAKHVREHIAGSPSTIRTVATRLLQR